MKYFVLVTRGIDVLSAGQELIDACGSLFPFADTAKKAIAYAKSVKKRFPDIKFVLYESDSHGSELGSLVMEF